MPQWVASHWPKYVEGCERAGRTADPANWRVAKSVFVADDLDTARRYATDPDSPYRFYYSQLFTKLKKHGRINLFKEHRDQPDDEVTFEGVCERLIIWGTPDKVTDELLAFREETGDFGTLLLAGKDWADVDLARRSMVLLAERCQTRRQCRHSQVKRGSRMSRINLGNVTLNAKVDGTGNAPWIVLSNSLGANLSMWDPQIEFLTGEIQRPSL